MKQLNDIFKGVKIEGGVKSKIVASLLDKIEEAKEEGYKLEDILEELNRRGLDTTYAGFRKMLSEIKKERQGEKMKRFILLANDKGGVGKTTLATLLNLPNSLILNLDNTREIADIYPYKKIVDFGKVKEEEGIEIEDFMEILNESNEFENIIVDTKGGITEDLIKVLPYVNSVIIPIKVGATSEKPSYEFILSLKEYLDELNDKEIKWGIVYNEISPKFLKKSKIGKYELIDELKENADLLKDEVLKDNLKAVTYFKRSEAIATRENKRKDIDELMKDNFGAYLVIKNEIKRLNKDLKEVIGGK